VWNLQHIGKDVLWCFRRRVPKESFSGGYQTNLGATLLGELLEIASFVGTPVGAVIAVAFCAAAFFYGRWVLSN
jgi:hypothetical protein